VVASIEQLRSSDGWRAYLQARGRFAPTRGATCS
jgi:hypothetical protein